MKKEYKTPAVEKLEFDYINVVAESGKSLNNTSPDLCERNGNNNAGWNWTNGSDCSKSFNNGQGC